MSILCIVICLLLITFPQNVLQQYMFSQEGFGIELSSANLAFQDSSYIFVGVAFWFDFDHICFGKVLPAVVIEKILVLSEFRVTFIA